jgi:hypothetical protein
MTTAIAGQEKSTIDRICGILAGLVFANGREGTARRQALPGVLAALVGRVHDPLGVAEMGRAGWDLDEEEIHADLEYGRD